MPSATGPDPNGRRKLFRPSCPGSRKTAGRSGSLKDSNTRRRHRPSRPASSASSLAAAANTTSLGSRGIIRGRCCSACSKGRHRTTQHRPALTRPDFDVDVQERDELVPRLLLQASGGWAWTGRLPENSTLRVPRRRIRSAQFRPQSGAPLSGRASSLNNRLSVLRNPNGPGWRRGGTAGRTECAAPSWHGLRGTKDIAR